jgi:hypothetical protein
MGRQRGRLTAREEQFVRLVVEEGHSFVAAFRLAYPPRNGARSAGAERTTAKRVAHRPLVQQRMEQLREELLASNPVEMRRRANAVLGQILAKRLDPRYRRTALDVLKRLDDQESAAMKADREAYGTAVAQIAAFDATEGSARKRARSTSARPPEKERPPVDLNQLINEIAQIAEQRRRSRELEPPLMPVLDSCFDDPPKAAREATQLLEEVVGERQHVVSQEQEALEPTRTDTPLCQVESSAERPGGEQPQPLTAEASENVATKERFVLTPIPGTFPRRFKRIRVPG